MKIIHIYDYENGIAIENILTTIKVNCANCNRSTFVCKWYRGNENEEPGNEGEDLDVYIPLRVIPIFSFSSTNKDAMGDK